MANETKKQTEQELLQEIKELRALVPTVFIPREEFDSRYRALFFRGFLLILAAGVTTLVVVGLMFLNLLDIAQTNRENIRKGSSRTKGAVESVVRQVTCHNNQLHGKEC